MLKTLVEMFTQKKFLIPLVTAWGAILSGNPAGAMILATAYIGGKGIMDVVINFQGQQSWWSENWLAQLIASRIFSTKLWMLAGIGLPIYYMAKTGMIPATGLTEPFYTMIITYMGAEVAEGIAPFIKKETIEKMLAAKKKPTESQQIIQDSPVALPNAPEMPSAQQPVAEAIPGVPFDKDKIMSLATAQAAVLEGKTSPSLERVLYSAENYAQDAGLFPAHDINQVRDGYSFLLQLAKQAYYEQASHAYGTAAEHLADKNLSCPYSSVMQMARDLGYEDTMREIVRLEDNLFNVEWAMNSGIDLIAKTPFNLRTIYGVGEIATQIYKATNK